MSINQQVREYEEKLKARLPDYAFAYEDGDRYIRTDYMVQIERQVRDYRESLLAGRGTTAEIEEKVRRYGQQLEDQTPDYEFAYEDGERYMRTEARVRWEKLVSQYRIKLLSELHKA
jgi:hypothetical protein